MSPTHETMRELSGLYVLGALAPTDLTEFEAHLATCEICRAEVSALAAGRETHQFRLQKLALHRPGGLKGVVLHESDPAYP